MPNLKWPPRSIHDNSSRSANRRNDGADSPILQLDVLRRSANDTAFFTGAASAPLRAATGID